MADVTIDGITVPAETIALLRTMIGNSGLNDEQLAAIILSNRNADGTPNLPNSAAYVWTIKAGEYAELVNVSESGSSRNLGDLYKNALAMAARYTSEGKTEEPVVDLRVRSRTRAITRPGA